jgi:hypothetical protein
MSLSETMLMKPWRGWRNGMSVLPGTGWANDRLQM